MPQVDDIIQHLLTIAVALANRSPKSCVRTRTRKSIMPSRHSKEKKLFERKFRTAEVGKKPST